MTEPASFGDLGISKRQSRACDLKKKLVEPIWIHHLHLRNLSGPRRYVRGSTVTG